MKMKKEKYEGKREVFLTFYIIRAIPSRCQLRKRLWSYIKDLVLNNKKLGSKSLFLYFGCFRIWFAETLILVIWQMAARV